MHKPPMIYTHEGRHRLELDEDGAIVSTTIDTLVMVDRIRDRIDRARLWAMMWPAGMHDVRDGRPLIGGRTDIRTRVLRRAAELRTEAIDAYYGRRLSA